MALGFEFSADALDAAGVLRVNLSVVLERAPVRGDAFATLLRQLVRSMCGDPRENAGRDWTGEIGTVLFHKRGAKFVDVG
mgnify:CR=1 FL=1